ncbi:hypothetical protein WJX77_009851 [Trebouxia sp. C0004]
MGSCGAILSVTVVFISVMAMDYYSTPLNESREFQIAGVAGDLSDVRAAGSLCELVHLAPQQAMQTAMAETWESSTAPAVASDKAPTSLHFDYIHMWTYPIKEQSLQRWQPDMSLSAAGAATTMASMLQYPTSVIATASTADGVSMPIITKPSGQSSADMLTLWVYWVNKQSMQQWQLELFAHAAVVPSTQAVAKPSASAAVAAAKQSYSPHAELTTEAALARSASAMEQGPSAAAPLAPVLSTAQAAFLEDVPAELEPVLLGVFMLALGGVILPGLSLWWEFGTIDPAVGAFIAPIDPPEPMTLKMKNAGIDASRSLKRKSSLIKARVTRDLPGLPSLQPLHHVLSGAESILARLMCLSSKVGNVIPEEVGEAASQSGASSAAASAAHSGGQAAAADNVQPGGQHSGRPQPSQPAQRGQPNQAPVGQGPQQAQRGAAPQQAQRGADAHQARRKAPQQQAQRGPIPQQAAPWPQQAQHAPHKAVLSPQQAQHVPYYGPRQLPALVPAAAVPALFVQQMPFMAPVPMPVISAGGTNVQVVAGPKLAADAGTQQASPKAQQMPVMAPVCMPTNIAAVTGVQK